MSEPGFELRREGERVEGLAKGIDRRHLRRLRRGEWEPEAELDLHGLSAPQAERALREALRDAYAAGLRCVQVIHGRGRGSAGAPVLKESLPGWLMEKGVAGRVMAFASAPAALGGAGATLVLLRRRR